MNHDGDFLKILLFVGFIIFKIISGFFKKAAARKDLTNPPVSTVKPTQVKRLAPVTKPMVPSDDLLEEALGKRKLSSFPQTIPSGIPPQPVKIGIPKFVPPISPIESPVGVEKAEQLMTKIQDPFSESLPKLSEVSSASENPVLLGKEASATSHDLIANLRDPKKIKQVFLLQEIFGEAPGLKSLPF